jgi:hypothetical protein
MSSSVRPPSLRASLSCFASASRFSIKAASGAAAAGGVLPCTAAAATDFLKSPLPSDNAFASPGALLSSSSAANRSNKSERRNQNSQPTQRVPVGEAAAAAAASADDTAAAAAVAASAALVRPAAAAAISFSYSAFCTVEHASRNQPKTGSHVNAYRRKTCSDQTAPSS